MKLIEGVPYYRFVIRYRLLGDKRSRRLVHWSPGYPWIRTEVARGLDERFGIENIKPGSVQIV